MAMKNSGPNTTRFANAKSVISCQESSNLWDLNETTIPLILFPVTSIASIAVILLNALVVIAFHQKTELKKASTVLLSSMAIADLLVGAISMPQIVAIDILIIRQIFYSGFCKLHLATQFSTFTLIASSLYHLTFIAWERYVAIRKWIDYKVIVTRDRMKNLAIMAWLLAAFTSLPPLVVVLVVGGDQKIKEVLHIGNVMGISCLITTGYFYIMVYLGVRKRKISEISNVTTLVKAKQEIKVAKTAGLITAVLILSFMPVIVIGGLRDVFQGFRTSNAVLLTETLVQLNSLANPLIYFYRCRRFRKAALELLRARKPETIQPAAGAALFIRRKEQLGSPEAVQERQAREQIRLKRAASCDLALNSGGREIFFKRSLSAPNLYTTKSKTNSL